MECPWQLAATGIPLETCSIGPNYCSLLIMLAHIVFTHPFQFHDNHETDHDGEVSSCFSFSHSSRLQVTIRRISKVADFVSWDSDAAILVFIWSFWSKDLFLTIQTNLTSSSISLTLLTQWLAWLMWHIIYFIDSLNILASVHMCKSV